MTRECPVRFCERLGVKLPGATLPGESVVGRYVPEFRYRPAVNLYRHSDPQRRFGPFQQGESQCASRLYFFRSSRNRS
jgi:hypothetical protein